MQNRCGAGKHGNGLRLGDKSHIGNGNGIFTQRNGLKMELPLGIGLRSLGKLRMDGLENYGDVRYGAVLRVVHNAADVAKNRGRDPSGRD